ncbi:MAG: O-antigen ligase family protein [Phycisphaerales bacterium]|nr:O-antigen ligase family protein [Phycisphaerales bacterium]
MRATPATPAPQPTPHGDMFDLAACLVLMAVLAGRILLAELFEPLTLSLLRGTGDLPGPTPAATAWLDAWLLAGAVAILARYQRWRGPPWVIAGVALLSAGVLVSSWVAEQPRLALLAGGNLVISVLAALALAVAVRTPWLLRALLTIWLAVGTLTAVKCIYQVAYELPETRTHWEREIRPRLLAEGRAADDPLLVNYERRMQSGEATGFLAHANITASVLAAWLACVAGLFVGVLRGLFVQTTATPRGPPVAALLLVTAILGLLGTGLALTGSLGAQVAVVAGILTTAAAGVLTMFLRRRPALVVAAIGAVTFVGILVTATYGMQRGTLPHVSLAFRWWYWDAAARAYAAAPWTGIGRENFQAPYIRLKAAESTEEVRNPHNLWVSLLVETGPLGLLGGSVLWIIVLLAAVRNWGCRLLWQARPPPARFTLTLTFLVAIGALVVQAACGGLPLGNPHVLIIWLIDVGAIFLVATLAVGWVLDRVLGTDPNWVTAGLLGALLVTWVHALVDFGLTTPGGLAAFALAAAAVGAWRNVAAADECAAVAASPTSAPQPCAGTRALLTRWVAPLGGIALVGIYIYGVAQPAGRDAQLRADLQRAEHGAVHRGDLPNLWRAARLLAEHGPSATAPRDAANSVFGASSAPGLLRAERIQRLEEALAYAQRGVERLPGHSESYATLARIEEELARRYRAENNPASASAMQLRAARSWDEALRRHPTSPRYAAAAGAAWLEVWRASRDPAAAARATAHFQAALAIDAVRPAESPVRLQPTELATITAALAELAPARN